MLAKKEMLEDIRLGFSVLQNYIRPGGPTNLTDINVVCEDFVAGVLNPLHDWDLKNKNDRTANAPCLDLFGQQAKIGVQVSSEEGATKINGDLACLTRHGMQKSINQYYHFSLVPRQGSYKIVNSVPGVSFDWKEDVWDFDSTLKQIQAADDSKIEAVRKYVRKSLPSIFAAEINRLAALRKELHACQTVFDREVMTAPFNREDPVEMYRAIKQMRITLQKRGASRIPHDEVAENFQSAKVILSACEGTVRERFPNIHQAARTGTTPTYHGGDYGDAIRLMMKIRSEIAPLLEANDKVLAEIDSRL